MKFKLLECEKPSPYTGVIFSLWDVQAAIEEYTENVITPGNAYGYFDDIIYDPIPFEKISHKIESIWTVENNVYCEVKYLKTDMGRKLLELGTKKIKCIPVWTGHIENNIVKDYKITSTHFFIGD